MSEKKEPRENYVVIVGCGRLGAHLAERINGRGSSVVVIDTNPDAFRSLPPDFSGFTIEGDATELSVLRQAKCSQADLFVAATGNDNLNLMAAQIAGPILGARRSLARVDDPETAAAFENVGIDVISPTTIMAGLFLTA